MTTFSDSAELTAQSLYYEINDKVIINNVSLSVKSAQTLFIEGSNGSGKTTLLRLLSGLLQPDEGQICWNQQSIMENRIAFNQQLLYIGHNSGVKPELTAKENLTFLSLLSGLPAKQGSEQALQWSGLQAFADSPCRHLSFGQQRRVALTQLMMTTARLWILDEPFSGLDRYMITDLTSRFIQHVNGGGLLVLTSHQPITLEGISTQCIQLG